MLALLLAAASAAAADRAADEAALRQAKLVAWPGFYRRQDADGLRSFLADGFVNFGPDGSRETKEQAVAWVRANSWPNASRNFRYVITDIAFYGPDTANVYGIGSFDGASCRMRYTSSNIFVRQGGRWRPMFSHTSSPACEKAGA